MSGSRPAVIRRSPRQRVTRIAKALMFRTGVVRLAREVGAPGRYLPVVRYHAVARAPDYCPPGIAVTPEQFERDVAFLVRHYEVLRIDDAVGLMEAGRPFPRGGVAITFDDGYLDNVTEALPILSRHGASAMFYVTAGPTVLAERFWVGWLERAVFAAPDPDAFAAALSLAPGRDRQALNDDLAERINAGGIEARTTWLARVEEALAAQGVASPDGRAFMLGPDDLRTLAAAGMEIGSHTVSHAVLTGLASDGDVLDELTRSRALIAETIGQPVEHLAYPNGPRDPGNFDARIARLAAEAGYRSAVTSERGAFEAGANRYGLPRHAVFPGMSLGEFAFKMAEHRFGALTLS